VDLPLPSPFGDNVARPPAESSLLAFRTEDLRAQIAGHLRITGIEASDFRDFWVAAGLPDPGPETHAFSFQRNPVSPPVLRLQLQTAPTGKDAGPASWQDIHWLVKPGQADFTSKIHLTAPSRELALVEFELPSEINVTDVTGPEVFAWSQFSAPSGTSDRPGVKNSRVQIWLKGMFADTSLALTGWTKLPEAPANPTAAAPDPKTTPPRQVTPNIPQTDDHYLFSLPAIRLLSAPDQRIVIRVETRPGWDLKLMSRKNIWPPPSTSPPVPSAQTGASEEFLTDRSDYEGTFQLLRVPESNSANAPKPQVKE
jgi:hypothetical protein